ncbi:MAG: hypothetical protein ACP5IB_08240 [Thermoplasmata archaeon]|jgi:hypothetical protein
MNMDEEISGGRREKKDYRGSHLKRFEIKSEIILALINGSLTFEELFEKINNTYKNKYIIKINKKKITRKDIKFHLYNEEYGLTKSKNGKVIILKNEKLSLNITNPVSLANMIDYLIINDEYGLKIQRALDLVFIVCVMSPYGDFPFESIKFYEYLKSNDIKFNNLSHIYDVIKMNGDIQGIKLLSKNNDEIKIALDAIKSIRGEINTYFKIAYILKVMEISKKVENLEINLKEYMGKFMLYSFSLFPLSKKEIEDQARYVQEDIVKEFFENIIKMTINEDKLKFIIYNGLIASRFDEIKNYLNTVIFLSPDIDSFNFMLSLKYCYQDLNK